MKTKKFIFVCAALLVVAFVSNLQWAMQDYGFKSITLSPQILAQGSDTNWWDKVTATVSQWWDDLHEYKKAYCGITRKRSTTTTNSNSGTITVGNGNVGLSGGTGLTVVEMATFDEYLYKCYAGKEDIFCSESWENSPY